MIRNSRNIRPSETLPDVVSSLVSCGFASISLMALWPSSLESIDHGSLCHAECKPSRDLALQRDVKLSRELFLLRCDVFLAIELDLKRKLPTSGKCSPRVRHKATSHLATNSFPKSRFPSGRRTSSTIPSFT